MYREMQIKDEPMEKLLQVQSTQPQPLVYTCQTCEIRFRHRHTLDAHRQHYCVKRKTNSSTMTETKAMKRKSTDIIDSSTKRLSLFSPDTHCQKCAVSFSQVDHQLHYCSQSSSVYKLKNPTKIPFNRPVRIGNLIYVPIPITSSQIDRSNQDNKPLDLSKPKTERKSSSLDVSIDKSSQKTVQQSMYRCRFCSIDFHSLKTLRAHQDNYCTEYRKENQLWTNTSDATRSQSLSSTLISKPSANESADPFPRSTLFICRLCQYRGNTLRGMRMHIKFHLSNHQACSDNDIMIKSPTLLKPNPPLLKCRICSAMFDYEETLLNHIKCVHTNEKCLKCLACQSRFCSKWNLIRHMKFAHTNIKYDQTELESSADSKSKSSGDVTRSTDLSMTRKFSCPFCYIQYRHLDTLKQHTTNYCSARPTTKHRCIQPKKTIRNETFCSCCQISFQYKTSYEAHKKYYCRGSSQMNVRIPA